MRACLQRWGPTSEILTSFKLPYEPKYLGGPILLSDKQCADGGTATTACLSTAGAAATGTYLKRVRSRSAVFSSTELLPDPRTSQALAANQSMLFYLWSPHALLAK